MRTKRASLFSLSLDLFYDVIVRLTNRRLSALSLEPDVSIAKLRHKAYQEKNECDEIISNKNLSYILWFQIIFVKKKWFRAIFAHNTIIFAYHCCWLNSIRYSYISIWQKTVSILSIFIFVCQKTKEIMTKKITLNELLTLSF